MLLTRDELHVYEVTSCACRLHSNNELKADGK